MFLSTLMLAVLLFTRAVAHATAWTASSSKTLKELFQARTWIPVLKWVGEEDEESIRKAFDMTLVVRDESEAAKTLADRHFFETLVRIHCASEGEGLTGLQTRRER